MEAEVTRPFMGVPDGETQCRAFKPGDKIKGSLAESMVPTHAQWVGEKAIQKSPQNKALGGAPDNRFRDNDGDSERPESASKRRRGRPRKDGDDSRQ